MNDPNDGAASFQWLAGVAMGLATLMLTLFGWLQAQITGGKRDALDRADSVRRETLLAVSILRGELTTRHEDAYAVQERQHADNKAEMQQLRSEIAANARVATEERRRVIDYLDGIKTTIAKMPDRDEMFAALVRIDRPKG